MQKNTFANTQILILIILLISCSKIEDDKTLPINRTITLNLTQIPEKTSIFFYANCSSEPLSNIQITINDHQIWNGRPDCNVTMDFFHSHMPRYLNIGENNIRIYAEKGYYGIENIMFKDITDKD